MRFKAGFLLLAALAASPAVAASPPELKPLERQLALLEAANPRNVGIAALDLATGQVVSVRGNEPFPMASTVKVAVAALYLRQVEMGRRTMDQTIRGVPARALMRRMLVNSDNPATDILLADLGGPRQLQKWFDQNGIEGMRIDRNIDQLLRAKRDLNDVRDSSTPLAMVELLRKIDKGHLINASSRTTLLTMMAECRTGRNRLRAGLPLGTRIEHKTGTLNGLSGDVGFISLPDGRRLAVAVFARHGSNRPATIATAARYIYDGFRNVGRRLMPAVFTPGAPAVANDPLAPLPVAAAVMGASR